MKQLLRAALAVFFLLVCSGAWAEGPVTVTDPYDSEWCFVIASQGPGTIKSSIDNNTFTFKGYVDRNGTRITGEINQNDVNALAGLTYPANYPTFLDLKGVSYSGNVTLTLNPIFTGLRLPFGSDLTSLPSTILFAFYSNYTKVNYNDGNNESIPIYLYVKEGGMSAAISKLGDYLKYRPVYLSGTYTEDELATLQTKDGITINPSSGEGSGGGGSTVDPSTLAEKIAARAQITNVPTIYIDLPGIGNQALNDYLYKVRGSSSTPEEAPYRPAKIQVVATSDTSSPDYLESFTEDAIDANGDMKIQGGTIIACGANGAETGIDINEQKKLYISGGYIFAIGGRVDGNLGSTTQGIISATGSVSANSSISVSNGSKTLFTFTMPPVSYSGSNVMIISTPDLSSGSTYTLTAGSSSASVTASNTISSGMGGGGMPGGGPGQRW